MKPQNFETLQKAIKGRIIFPSDPDYEKMRRVLSGEIDRRPAAIVRVLNGSDVQQTIAFAQENNLELSVRSGGHSTSGFSVIDNGIMVDLRDLHGIDIDLSEKTAWVGAGLTAGEVTRELDKYNLVLGFGDTGSVGVGGITLGGGSGLLVRKFGLTIDNLLAAEIVTADKQVLLVDSENHPDLFWAIRGGGGNFGVVTKFKYKLHELGECYGGIMFLPATPEVISGFVEIAQSAPNELSTIINIMPTPPMPFVPQKHHGQLSVMAMIMYAGEPEDGEKIVDQIRALASPLADMVKPMRYKDMFFPENPDYHPTAVAKTFHMKSVDRLLAEKIIQHLNALNVPMRALQLRVLGGAQADIPAEATAYAHRQSKIMGNAAIFYQTEQERKNGQNWVNKFLELLDQGDPAVYVNFLGPYDPKERIQNAYPGQTWQRLIEIKKKYDPANFFHNNVNIVL